ncbi:MAG: PhoH family protein, partial [Desulfosarcinaceae bacterium]
MEQHNQQTKITFSDLELARQLFGEHNSHLQHIARHLDMSIQARGNTVHLQGDKIAVELARNLLTQLYGLAKERYPLYPNDIDYAIRMLSADDSARLKDIFLDTVFITSKKQTISPKSPAQKAYIDAMRQYDIVFGVGPAGTG